MKYEGVVKPYSGNGRKLGYPTANIAVVAAAPEGVFVGYTVLRGQTLPSIIFIGVPETVGDTVKRAEAHILNFADEDLYGEHIIIQAVEKLRDNHKFDDVASLLQQIKIDEQQAQQWHNKKR